MTPSSSFSFFSPLVFFILSPLLIYSQCPNSMFCSKLVASPSSIPSNIPLLAFSLHPVSLRLLILSLYVNHNVAPYYSCPSSRPPKIIRIRMDSRTDLSDPILYASVSPEFRLNLAQIDFNGIIDENYSYLLFLYF